MTPQPSGGTVWLGVDLGTQGARVAAVDAAGSVALAQAPLHSARPGPGRHEQDPAEWNAAVAAACRAVLAERRPTRVAGVAVCGTSGTLLLADRAGRPLGPALMYDDARARAEFPRAAAALAACAERNGYRVQPTWALPKLLWAVEHVTGARDGRLYHSADAVGSWLAGGPVATDASHALKTGFDLVAGRWPVEALDELGIPAGVLPPVVRPGTVVGAVRADAAAETGIPAGTPLVAGMTDGCAAQLASGAVRAGRWNCALGTTLVLKGVTPDLLRDPAGAVYSHPHPDEGWLPGGASSCGAGVLAAAFPGADLVALDRAAAARVPTPVVAYPLRAPGERFPFVRPDAAPFTVGKPRDDVERYAALLQGVAFVARLGLAYVEALGAAVRGPVAFTGGATRSAFWNQMHADVLGRQVRVPWHPDAAVGMAVLAAAATGAGNSSAPAHRPVADVADALVAGGATTYDPRPERTARYREVYRRLVDELERRGHLDPGLAGRARAA